jgi:hypothetical protein
MASTITLTRRVGPRLVEIGVLARDSGVHPEVVGRLVRLGLLETAAGDSQFSPDAAARLARAVRLRRDLGLSYGAAVLTCELLARIDELEARLRRYEPPTHRPR